MGWAPPVLPSRSAPAAPSDINGLALNGSNNYQSPWRAAARGGGAIINSGAAQSNALRTITLAGDAAFGGANEWDLQAVSGGPATLTGNGFNLTKTGANRIAVCGQASALVSGVQNININQGTLALTYNTTVDNAAPGSIYVNNGATLSVGNYGATPGVSILKPLAMNGGTLQTDSTGSNGNATIAANISLNAMPTLGNYLANRAPTPEMAAANIVVQSGSMLTLSGIISDGAASNGMVLLAARGTVAIAGTSANTYSGDTVIGNRRAATRSSSTCRRARAWGAAA